MRVGDAAPSLDSRSKGRELPFADGEVGQTDVGEEGGSGVSGGVRAAMERRRRASVEELTPGDGSAVLSDGDLEVTGPRGRSRGRSSAPFKRNVNPGSYATNVIHAARVTAAVADIKKEAPHLPWVPPQGDGLDAKRDLVFHTQQVEEHLGQSFPWQCIG
jgi:hypothetical protein